MLDGPALQAIDDRIHGRSVRRAAPDAAQRRSVDDETDLDDVDLVDVAAMLLTELDRGIRPVIEDPIESSELPFDVLTVRIGDADVLAPDRGSHRCSPPYVEGILGRPA